MASLETTRGLDARTISRIRRNPQQALDIINNVDVPSKINYRASESYTPQTAPQSRQMNVPTDMYGTAPATRKRRSTNGSYKIQKGDTLSAIAKRYGTTVQAIAEANGIADVNKIYVDDSLTIPGNTTARTTSTPTQRTNTSSTTTNQNIRARQNRTQPTPQEDNRLYRPQRQLPEVNITARRIPTTKEVQQRFHIPTYLPETRVTSNRGFTREDMSAIRLSQQQNPPVLYNTRSKPSLRRYQRYK